MDTLPSGKVRQHSNSAIVGIWGWEIGPAKPNFRISPGGLWPIVRAFIPPSMKSALAPLTLTALLFHPCLAQDAEKEKGKTLAAPVEFLTKEAYDSEAEAVALLKAALA